jgi:DHA1 family inner membrane transport protein
MPIALIALTLGAFAIGTSEFLIVGLLPDVARDLHVSISSAGLLVTFYALGVVVGAPILAIAAARLSQRSALCGLMTAYAAGNLLCAFAPDYTVLMVARVMTAMCHGAFFGIGSIVAAELVPPAKRGQAIATMFSGLTLANILGVPAGTLLGQHVGWRASFCCVVAVALVAAVVTLLVLPKVPRRPSPRWRDEFKVLRRPQVILAMLMSVLLSASLFSVFTYITPMLETVTHYRPSGVTWLLLLFGVGTAIGNLIGGRMGDWRLMPSIAGTQVGLVIILALLTLALPSRTATAVSLLLWGMLTYAMAAPLQMRVVDTAPQAPNLVATVNQGAFNLGNAGGAWLGGAALTAGMTYQTLPALGAGLSIVGLMLTGLSIAHERFAKAAARNMTMEKRRS